MKRHAQSGQVIVLLALVAIGLIASMGLAIDGGRLLFLRRDTQNAADAGALAGAYRACKGGSDIDVEQSARGLVKANGFVDGQEVQGVVGSQTENVIVNISHPSMSETFVEVKVGGVLPATFMGVLHVSFLRATSLAVSRCSREIAVPNALMVATSSCQNALNISGSNLTIEGSLIAIKSDVKLSADGRVDGIVVGGEGFELHPSLVLNPSEDNPLFDPNIDVDLLSFQISDFRPGGNEAILAGGDYHSYTGNTTLSAKLEGLYFVDGNVKVRSDFTVGPKGMTIVAAGTIDFAGNTVELVPYIRGRTDGDLLLFSSYDSKCGQPTISISSSRNDWLGLIYAPYGNVNMSNATNAGIGRIFAENIQISGSGLTFIDKDHLDPFYRMINMAK